MKTTHFLAAIAASLALGGCISFPAGPAGPQGATGDTGATGNTGARGAAGTGAGGTVVIVPAK